MEDLFVAEAKARGYDIDINPEKHTDPTVPDLVVGDRIADVKYQGEPFFKAGQYGVDPTYAITFNRKDYERYGRKYPDLDIFVWLQRQADKRYGVSVGEVRGCWTIPFKELAALIEAGAPEHRYQNRWGGGNAKSSFVLDVRNLRCLWRDK